MHRRNSHPGQFLLQAAILVILLASAFTFPFQQLHPIYDASTGEGHPLHVQVHDVIPNQEGVPILQPGDKPAKDPQHIIDAPFPTHSPNAASKVSHKEAKASSSATPVVSLKPRLMTYTPLPRVEGQSGNENPSTTPSVPKQPVSPSSDASPSVQASTNPSVTGKNIDGERPFNGASPSKRTPTASPNSVSSYNAEEIQKQPSPSQNEKTVGTVTPSLLPSVKPNQVKESSLVSPGRGTTCVYFGDGSIPGFLSANDTWVTGNVSTFSISDKQFPNLKPPYRSHIFSKKIAAWSLTIPTMTGRVFSIQLGFAEIYGPACLANSQSGFRIFRVSIHGQSKTVDVMASVGCAMPLQLAFDNVLVEPGQSGITIKLKGITQSGMLSTVCYNDKLKEGKETPGPMRTSIPILSASVTTSPILDGIRNVDANLISPGLLYSCINFGRRRLLGYQLFSNSSLTGDAQIQNGVLSYGQDDLPEAYQSFAYGKSWSYRFTLPTTSTHRIMLGYAETSPKSCGRREKVPRLFTVALAGGLQMVDVKDSVGCATPYQTIYDSVSSVNNNVDVVFNALSRNAMLSVICFSNKPVHSLLNDTILPPTPTGMPRLSESPASPSAKPSSLQSSLTPKESHASVSISQENQSEEDGHRPKTSNFHCFKFGKDNIRGFQTVTNLKLGNGLNYFSNPVAPISSSSPFDDVYKSHVFGNEFTIEISTNTSFSKSVVLGFAEIYKTSCEQKRRLFELRIGSISRTLDVYKEVGCMSPLNIRFDGIPITSDSLLRLSFKSIEGNAMISGLCIQDNEKDVDMRQYRVGGFPIPRSERTDGNSNEKFNVQVLSSRNKKIWSPTFTPSTPRGKPRDARNYKTDTELSSAVPSANMTVSPIAESVSPITEYPSDNGTAPGSKTSSNPSTHASASKRPIAGSSIHPTMTPIFSESVTPSILPSPSASNSWQEDEPHSAPRIRDESTSATPSLTHDDFTPPHHDETVTPSTHSDNELVPPIYKEGLRGDQPPPTPQFGGNSAQFGASPSYFGDSIEKAASLGPSLDTFFPILSQSPSVTASQATSNTNPPSAIPAPTQFKSSAPSSSASPSFVTDLIISDNGPGEQEKRQDSSPPESETAQLSIPSQSKQPNPSGPKELPTDEIQPSATPSSPILVILDSSIIEATPTWIQPPTTKPSLTGKEKTAASLNPLATTKATESTNPILQKPQPSAPKSPYVSNVAIPSLQSNSPATSMNPSASVAPQTTNALPTGLPENPTFPSASGSILVIIPVQTPAPTSPAPFPSALSIPSASPSLSNPSGTKEISPLPSAIGPSATVQVSVKPTLTPSQSIPGDSNPIQRKTPSGSPSSQIEATLSPSSSSSVGTFPLDMTTAPSPSNTVAISNPTPSSTGMSSADSSFSPPAVVSPTPTGGDQFVIIFPSASASSGVGVVTASPSWSSSGEILPSASASSDVGSEKLGPSASGPGSIPAATSSSVSPSRGSSNEKGSTYSPQPSGNGLIIILPSSVSPSNGVTDAQGSTFSPQPSASTYSSEGGAITILPPAASPSSGTRGARDWMGSFSPQPSASISEENPIGTIPPSLSPSSGSTIFDDGTSSSPLPTITFTTVLETPIVVASPTLSPLPYETGGTILPSSSPSSGSIIFDDGTSSPPLPTITFTTVPETPTVIASPTLSPLPSETEEEMGILLPSETEDETGILLPSETEDETGILLPSETEDETGILLPSETEDEMVILTSNISPTAVPSASLPSERPASAVMPDPSDSGFGGGAEGSEDTNTDGDEEVPSLVAGGQWKGLMGTGPTGRGFTIGMGLLGAFLILLLLICVFFAIFRSGYASLSYASQFSRRPPNFGGGQSGFNGGGKTTTYFPEDASAATGGTGGFVDPYSSGTQGGHESGNPMGDTTVQYEVPLAGAGGPGTVLEASASAVVASYGDYMTTRASEDADVGNIGDIGDTEASRAMSGAMSGYEGYAAMSTGNTTAIDVPYGQEQDEPYVHPYGQAYDEPYIVPYEGMRSEGDQESSQPEGGHVPVSSTGYGVTECNEDCPVNGEQEDSVDFDYEDAAAAYVVEDIEQPEAMRREESQQRTVTFGTGTEINIEQLVESSFDNADEKDEYGDGFTENDEENDKNQGNGPPSGVIDAETEASLSIISNPAATPYERDMTMTLGSDVVCDNFKKPVSYRKSRRFLALGTTQESPQLSVDGPWPAWWPNRQRSSQAADKTMELFGGLHPLHCTGNEGSHQDHDVFRQDSGNNGDDEGEACKENSSLPSNSVGDSQRTSGENGTNNSNSRSMSNKSAKKCNVLRGDSDWRRDLNTVSAKHEQELSEREFDPEYDYLRRRREPYVKSVTSRLSVGVVSFSKTGAADNLGNDGANRAGRRDVFRESSLAARIQPSSPG